MFTMSDKGRALLKSFEGLHDGDKRTAILEPQLDPLGIPTLGWGAIYDLNGDRVTMKTTPITLQEAEDLLTKQIKTYEDAVNKMVKVPINQNQFDALTDFAYNMGISALQSSTLMKKLNSGDYQGAALEFPKWNKGRVKGVLTPLAGLTRRRAAEQTLFTTKPV